MNKKIQRTITEVLNIQTGEPIDANEFFKKPLDEIHNCRSELQRSIENIIPSLFVCYYCKQKIRIRGGIGSPGKRKIETYHFAHLKDSDECHIKTKNQYTKEEYDAIKYNGAKESPLHENLKERIAEFLRRNNNSIGEVSNVEVEKVIKEKTLKEWKKPDINAFFKNKRIAIELQLSTTWLDVITRRQHFYQQQGIYILWVFHRFDLNDELRKLTINDVIYTNNQNAYVFDEQAYQESKKANDLILKCYYKVYSSREWRYHDQNEDSIEIHDRWENKFVRLSDLTFNEDSFKVYFHDTENQKREAVKQRDEIRKQIREAREEEESLEEERQQREHIRKRRVDELNKEIWECQNKVNQIGHSIEAIENKLNEVNQFLLHIDLHTEATVKYLSEENGKVPFWGYYDLLKDIATKFGRQYKDQHKKLQDIINNSKESQQKIDSINNLELKSVGGIDYRVLNPEKFWNFMMQNWSNIWIIPKTAFDELFPKDQIRKVRNEHDLAIMNNRKDVFFLIDFKPRTEELQMNIKANRELEEKNKEALALINVNIKSYLLSFMNDEIKRLEDEKEVKKTTFSNHNSDLNKKNQELKVLTGY